MRGISRQLEGMAGAMSSELCADVMSRPRFDALDTSEHFVTVSQFVVMERGWSVIKDGGSLKMSPLKGLLT